MFAWIMNHIKARLALTASGTHPVTKRAMSSIRVFLSEADGFQSRFSPEFKRGIGERLVQEVGQVLSAADPVMTNRDKLSDHVCRLATYAVLVIPSVNESKDDPTGLRGKAGITGELKGHIKELAGKNEEIREACHSMSAFTIKPVDWNLENPTERDLYEACLAHWEISRFNSQIFNSLRIGLGDHHPTTERDWYVPFVAAMCAMKEYEYRSILGLPEVLTAQSGQSFAALHYSSFLNIVLSGAKQPYVEWKGNKSPKNA